MYTPCNYTMSAFYKSISLSRVIHVDKINDLNSSEQTVLKDELKVAIEEMKFMVARVKKERVSTENETWLHKVNKKINICNQFIRIIDLQKERGAGNLLNDEKRGSIFFVTHRLSLIKDANLIVVFHKGRIDELGTHRELIEKKGRYFALLQQSKEL